MTIRPIEAAEFRAPDVHNPGPAPSLLWIPIEQLVVDESYQRRITKSGREAVQRIVDGFSWPMFSPVIVAPVEGGRYAIVDGQHRTTAAAVCGIEQVPCQVVQADRRGQARAFAAVNGNVTKITSLQVYRAAVEAGDGWAVDVDAVCRGAGLTVLRYPIQATSPRRPRHSTMAIRPIQEMISRHGKDHAARVLGGIAGTALGDDPAAFGIHWLGAVSSVVAERSDPDAAVRAFLDDLDAGEAMLAARRSSGHGISLTEALTIELRRRLSERVDDDQRAAA